MIRLTGIEKKYHARTVLEINELTFENGKTYALIGANGCGKTTLLQILAHLISADKGKVAIDDGVKACYMPQQSIGFCMSVQNNVKLVCKELERKNARERIQYLLHDLELWSLRKKNASRLSGGETQRVALARALVMPHSILLLDEPTAAMDVGSAMKAENIIKEYIKENGCILIFSSHSFGQVERLADEVIFLHEGKIVEKGDPQSILHNPQTDEAKTFLDYLLVKN